MSEVKDTNLAKRSLVGIVAAICLAAAIRGVPLMYSAQAQSPQISFKEQVLPIFEQDCAQCHNPDGIGYKSIGLDLRSYQGLMAGSRFGTAIIPGQPEHSPLIAVLQRNGHPFPLLQSYKNLQMPPLGPPLSSAELNTVIEWIRQGAKDN